MKRIKYSVNYGNNALFDYNNTVHSSTGFKPIEIFYSTSEKFCEEVFNNTLNSFKYINNDSTIFKNFEKVLLSSNFIIDKTQSNNKFKTLIFNKVKKKKTFIKLCVSICEVSGAGFYKIIIEKDYKNFNLKKYDICKVSNALLRKTDEDIWNQIYDGKYDK